MGSGMKERRGMENLAGGCYITFAFSRLIPRPVIVLIRPFRSFLPSNAPSPSRKGAGRTGGGGFDNSEREARRRYYVLFKKRITGGELRAAPARVNYTRAAEIVGRRKCAREVYGTRNRVADARNYGQALLDAR